MANDSEDKYDLMGEVERLQSKLRKAGQPVDPLFANRDIFASSLEKATTPETRLKMEEKEREFENSGGRPVRDFPESSPAHVVRLMRSACRRVICTHCTQCALHLDEGEGRGRRAYSRTNKAS
jgi:hypothetical protein